MSKEMSSDVWEKKVVKRGEYWCIIHTKGPLSGKILKGSCKKEKHLVERQHRAIMRSEMQRIEKSSIPFEYYSTSKPFYRFELPLIHEDIAGMGWDKEQLLIDVKCDGMRVSIQKLNDEVKIFVDPIDLKRKSNDITNRLPLIVDEIKKHFPNNCVLDGELYAANEDVGLHRTVINGIVNSKDDAENFSSYVYLYVFDVLFYNGVDIRNLPLEERLEKLNQIKSTAHAKIETMGKTSFIVEGENKSQINHAIEHILDGNHGLPPGVEEGIMIKKLSSNYEAPANHGWAKVKRFYEVDAIAYDRKLVKDQTKIWNYFLGIVVSKEYFEKLPDNVRIQINDTYLMKYGKSDNTKIDVQPSSSAVIRVASEEVNEFENEEYPKAPWYRGYINVALMGIPEKSTSDRVDVLERLSMFQPRRMRIDELAKLKHFSLPKEIKKEFIEKIQNADRYTLESILTHFDFDSMYGRFLKREIKHKLNREEEKTKSVTPLCPKEYKELLGSGNFKNKSLPTKYYKNHKVGDFWVQCHIRGISMAEYEDYKSDKIPLWKCFLNHSLHVDWRAKFVGLDRLMQFVLVEDSIDSYLRVMKGEGDPKTKQVGKGLVVIKPSAMEPSDVIKKEKKEMLLNESDAKKIESLIIKEKSFFIPPGEVGATKNGYGYLGCIAMGTVDAGSMRNDYKETFCKSEIGSNENKEIFNGRWIWKAFKEPSLWWAWEAVKTPEPSNPWIECDQGSYKLKPANQINRFSRKDYPEYKKRIEMCKMEASKNGN